MIYSQYIPVGAHKQNFAPRITPIQLRKLLWHSFGKKVYVKTKKNGTGRVMTEVYVTDRKIFNHVAEIVCKYEDLFDHPDAQLFNLVPVDGIPAHHSHYKT